MGTAAILGLIASAASGLGVGFAEPLIAPQILKAMPTVIKAARLGMKHLPKHERPLTEQEIEYLEHQHATTCRPGRSFGGRWFR